MRETIVFILKIGACVSAVGLFVFGAIWLLLSNKKNQTQNIINNTNVPTTSNFDGSTTLDLGQSLLASVHHVQDVVHHTLNVLS